MKLLFFDDFKLGVLQGNSVIDVTDVLRQIPHTAPHNFITGLIERFGDYRSVLEQAVASSKGVPVETVRIRAPLPRPVNID